MHSANSIVLATTSKVGVPSYLSVLSQLSVTTCDGLGVYALLLGEGFWFRGANTLKALHDCGARIVMAMDSSDEVFIVITEVKPILSV